MASTEQDDNPTFKPSTLAEIFKLALDPTTRVGEAPLHLSAEYLRLFTIEAFHRSAEIAIKEQEELEEQMGKGKTKGKGAVIPSLLEAKHLEKVLAGLLLDF